MSYEVYRKKLSKEDYFNGWDSENYNMLTDLLRDQIYEKYLIKCEVFQRDNFTCQNQRCKKSNSTLTMHHIKFQKNGGGHKARNCITLCDTCHKDFHRGKIAVYYFNTKNVPAHIRGLTLKVDIKNEINWKQVKKEMRKFRKSLGNVSGLRISWEELSILLKFLEFNYEED